MTGALGDQVDRIVTTFNASQSAIEVEAIHKGTYPETMTATIAAWRANQAPHIAQVFDVGTGSMLAAGPATKQVWQLIQETGVAINPNAYIPSVRGYYSLANGKLAAMPFNSSTAVMWYNKDAFATAGLDPEKPPTTWDALEAALRKIKAKIDADAGKPAEQRAMGSGDHSDDLVLVHLGAVRAILGHPQHPVCHRGGRLRRTGRELKLNSAADGEAACALPGHGEGRHIQIRGPRFDAGRRVLFRPGRGRVRFVGGPRRHPAQCQVQVGRGAAAVRSGDHRPCRSTPSSAAPRCGR